MKKLTIAEIEKCSNDMFVICFVNKNIRGLHQIEVTKESLLAEMYRLKIKDVQVITTLNGILSLKFF